MTSRPSLALKFFSRSCIKDKPFWTKLSVHCGVTVPTDQVSPVIRKCVTAAPRADTEAVRKAQTRSSEMNSPRNFCHSFWGMSRTMNMYGFIIFRKLFQCCAGMGREREKINLLNVCFEGIEITFLSV